MIEGDSRRKLDRWVGAAFGLLFIGLGVAVLVFGAGENPIGASVAALVIGGLGADALFCALRGRRSLLSRIGPMP